MSVISKLKKPLILLTIGVIIVVYFIHLSNRNKDNTDKLTDDSVVSEYISRDMVRNYPGTPRSVVILYSSMIKALYENDLTDEEIEGMAKNMYAMFDTELRDKNPYDTYVSKVKLDIEAYAAAKKLISDFVVEDYYNIDDIPYQGEDYVKIDVLYYVHEDTTIIKVYEEYTLRKDDDGNWKILFWEISDSNKMEG